jgi:hypothetical protein
MLCLLALQAASSAQAEIRVVQKIATVPLVAASFDEAATQFDRQRATTFGTVQARFDASYTLRFFPGWCQVTGAVVEATVSGTLPQWTGEASADAATRQRWGALTADPRERRRARDGHAHPGHAVQGRLRCRQGRGRTHRRPGQGAPPGRPLSQGNTD